VPEEAIPELDRFEQSAIARFLTKADLLVADARKAVLELAELRNRYAHGSGTKPHEDALKAVGLLHDVVNRTVSFFAGQERFGSGPQADSLQGAVGSFGFEPTNPIPGDYVQYCAELRCPQGHPYDFKRRGSVGEAPDHHIVDRVSLLCVGGENSVDLFFDGSGAFSGRRHTPPLIRTVRFWDPATVDRKRRSPCRTVSKVSCSLGFARESTLSSLERRRRKCCGCSITNN